MKIDLFAIGIQSFVNGRSFVSMLKGNVLI